MSIATSGAIAMRAEASRIPPDHTATVQPLGCTLQTYAKAKCLPEPFLKSLGLTDTLHAGAAAVRMVYKDRAGTDCAVRFRTRLEKTDGEDNRFRWKVGAKPFLYGLWRLRTDLAVCVVEGESDCHTLWHHGINAVGLPGAGTWKEARDAEHLTNFQTIFVLIEPDAGGEAAFRWIEKSGLRDRIRLVRLVGFKDPSAMHVSDPEQFQTRWRSALETAVPWSAEDGKRQDGHREEAWTVCGDLASLPDILDTFAAALQAVGLVGVEREAKLLYLAVTSRVLDRPISIAVKGPSSAGKSFLVEKVLSFCPAESFFALTAMSDRALAYGDEPLQHRMLVLYEAEGMSGDTASYLIRSLLSEGCLRYETVEKTAEGLRGRLIERAGPTGLIVTTTSDRLHPENETRLISLTLADGQDQTRAILDALADEDQRDDLDRTQWHALQTWIAASDPGVTVPFGKQLVEMIPPIAVRLRRDTKLLLNLVRAHALLHQANRVRNKDGRIVATLGDFAAIHALVAEYVAEGVQASVSLTLRETVESVARLAKKTGSASVQQIATDLKLDKSAASRRCQAARNSGYLRNEETSRGRPARYVPGDPLPEEQTVLPHPEELAAALSEWTDRCTVAGETEGVNLPRDPDEGDRLRTVVL